MLRVLKKFFKRKAWVDPAKKPDRLLDWTDPDDRSEGVMRFSQRSAQEVARKMFEEFPPTLGILPKNEEMAAMAHSIRPMFIHIAMEKMWAVWNPAHPFAKATAYKVAGKYARAVHQRKTEMLKRMYPLLRTMEEEMALEMIERLLERFDAKLKIYDGSRTYIRDPDKSPFHRMALHVATQFYLQRDRPGAQRKLVQVAVREAGLFSRRM
jgi:hypothetical protein